MDKSRLVVMKFGGTSVADADKIRHAAGRVVRKKRSGCSVVAVVSAPGEFTDELLYLARGISPTPDPRELDVLLATGEQLSIALFTMAVKQMGQDAISLTGPQAGIHADEKHTQARIVKIDTQKIRHEVRCGRVVIVAGFQGLSPDEDITTLGRGGSDLTAVALAAALKARSCEIYTDVKGIYTADPGIVPEARKIGRISFDEMLELASSGAQVMQARSIEVAKKFSVSIHVRSAFYDGEGTWIGEEGTMEEAVVSGVTLDKDQVRITVLDVPDRPGMAAKIFTELAAKNVRIDMILQSGGVDRLNNISFTIEGADLPLARHVLEHRIKGLGIPRLIYDEQVAKISAVGIGIKSHVGIAARMFNTLASEGINIEMISTSDIRISCVVAKARAEDAVRALHKAFRLQKKMPLVRRSLRRGGRG